LRRRPVQLATAGSVAAAGTALGLFLALGNHGRPELPPAQTRQAAAPAPVSRSHQPATAAQPTAVLMIAGRAVTDTEAQHLRRHAGEAAEAHRARVTAVPADEGFWISNGHQARVWVELIGHGESPETIKTGERVSFRGIVVGNAATFLTSLQLGKQDGSLLHQQGAHLEVAFKRLEHG
jgi:hypothetical protein